MPEVNGKKYPYTAKGKAAAKKAAAAMAAKPKAKSTSYVGNVIKEVKQTAKSASNAVDKYLNGNRPLPKGMKIGPSNVKAEAGQLAGAVLQGRRYSDKTGKQIVASPTNKKQPKKAVSSKQVKPVAKKAAMPVTKRLKKGM